MPYYKFFRSIKIRVGGRWEKTRVQLEEFFWVSICPEGEPSYTPDLLKCLVEGIYDCLP